MEKIQRLGARSPTPGPREKGAGGLDSESEGGGAGGLDSWSEGGGTEGLGSWV